ncbi:unnamed protein product [Lupinus luteus]|uniref:Anaphase-promoting complex subunit 4-like WD40 domain-containing protein n=1 Tax=Lupinus luteus TaxID=3873 RepID=A0AAV1XWL9_LUPLU
MVKDNLKKPALTAFTRNGDYVAVLSADGTAKISNTSNGCLVAEWKTSDGDPDISYSCIACNFTGKKRRKEKGTWLLALGTVDGSILAVDVSTGERKWTTSHPGGVCGLSFANKGHLLRVVGHKGTASEINIETGEVLKEFKFSKKSISSLAFSYDEKYLAIVSSKLRVKSWENGKEVLKFPGDLENVQYVSVSSNAKAVVTSDFEGKNLQVWRCDLNYGTVRIGPTLSMRHSPLFFECHRGFNEDDLVVFAVSGSGTTYVWNLSASSEGEIQPTKITVKAVKENSESSKKRRNSIIAFRIQSFEEDKQIKALVAYGSVDHPQFSVLNISNSGGENIALNVRDETNSDQQHDNPSETVPLENKKSKKRQATSDPDNPTTTDKVDFDQGEAADELLLDDDPSEPTMGEKLASLSLPHENKSKSDKEQESSVLAKGAILACAVPWLKHLLLHHASGIMSHESSLQALNSLYQLIESRVSTFKSAIQLSSCLDILYSGVIEEEVDEGETIPVIYEDDDSEEESEDDDSEGEQQSDEVMM